MRWKAAAAQLVTRLRSAVRSMLLQRQLLQVL